MSLRTTVIIAGLAAALGSGNALAQPYSQEAPPPGQQMPYGHHGHHHGMLDLIRQEVAAGRISHREGTLLERKIQEMKAERRAERQARYENMQGRGGYGPGYGQGNYAQGNYQQGNYQQGNYPPPPSQQPPR